jgi:P-type conjugative transfer protein TrbJ
VGSLQATQAGNQLIALQNQQLADLIAVVTAQSRAQTIEAARQTANQDQAKLQFQRFLVPGASTSSSSVQMFH